MVCVSLHLCAGMCVAGCSLYFTRKSVFRYRFDFMDAPPLQALVQALQTLYWLGALDENGSSRAELWFSLFEHPTA